MNKHLYADTRSRLLKTEDVHHFIFSTENWYQIEVKLSRTEELCQWNLIITENNLQYQQFKLANQDLQIKIDGKTSYSFIITSTFATKSKFSISINSSGWTTDYTFKLTQEKSHQQYWIDLTRIFKHRGI